jgi:hypothetical protein
MDSSMVLGEFDDVAFFSGAHGHENGWIVEVWIPSLISSFGYLLVSSVHRPLTNIFLVKCVSPTHA